MDVIVDDTNLSKRAIDHWEWIAGVTYSDIEFIKIDTDIEECIRRDSLRANPVGEEAIRKMAARC